MKGIVTSQYSSADIRVGVETLQARDETRSVIDRFAALYYEQPFTWPMTYWQGVPLLKYPTDLWVLQDIIHDLKPKLVIETGTALGGSALFFAHMLDLQGNPDARVLSIDIDFPDKLPGHKRITYCKGSSVAEPVLRVVRDAVEQIGDGQTFITLDSDHHFGHVLAELHAYSEFIRPNGLMLVEDTNVNGHPVYPDFGSGPYEAVDLFLSERPDWRRDTLGERYLLTAHPGGWLRRLT